MFVCLLNLLNLPFNSCFADAATRTTIPVILCSPVNPGRFSQETANYQLLRRNAEHNQYALTADQPNLSSGPGNQPSLDPITPASRPLRINPPEPAALRRLFLHTLVDREPSSPPPPPHRHSQHKHRHTHTLLPKCLALQRNPAADGSAAPALSS